MRLTTLATSSRSDGDEWQRPRISHVPEYVSSAGDEAVKLARVAGLHLDEWQQFVLRESLGEVPGGRWAAQTVGLVVGRQNGKGAVLEARELFGLFALGERQILHTAHRQKIATNHFRRLRDLIRRTPQLHARVAKYSEGKGAEAIVLKDGRLIEFATRQSGNARGLTADLIVYDEAMFLAESDRSSISPTMAARSMSGNIQSWYAGSAVDRLDPSQDGLPFAQIREAGIARSPGMAFFEWSALDGDPGRFSREEMANPEWWEAANPGLDIRISREWVDHERLVEMGPRGFAVERLGIGDWPDTTVDADRVVSGELWNGLAERDPSNRIVSGWAYAVDTSWDQTWGAVAVAGARADGLHQVAVVQHARGTDWVVERCAALHDLHPGAVFVVDKLGPAANLIGPLRLAGLTVLEASSRDYADAFADFVADATDGRLRYPFPQPELDDALSAARKERLGDRWKWSRKNSTSADISPLVAVTLARWGATQRPEEAPPVRPDSYFF